MEGSIVHASPVMGSELTTAPSMIGRENMMMEKSTTPSPETVGGGVSRRRRSRRHSAKRNAMKRRSSKRRSSKRRSSKRRSSKHRSSKRRSSRKH